MLDNGIMKRACLCGLAPALFEIMIFALHVCIHAGASTLLTLTTEKRCFHVFRVQLCENTCSKYSYVKIHTYLHTYLYIYVIYVYMHMYVHSHAGWRLCASNT
jgi:hypothetical protein